MEETIGDQQKSPKKKKQKLTKEQRMERARLAALELKKRLMREQLLREIELHKKSFERSKLYWEDTLREIRADEFRKEFKDWGVRTEVLMERKDQKIEFLRKTIDETNEMRNRNFGGYLEQLEYLKNCHQSLIEAANKVYEKEALQMLLDSIYEFEYKDETYAIMKNKIENVLHSYNAKISGGLRSNFAIYLKAKTNAVATELEQCYDKRDKTCEKMKKLHKNLLDFQHMLNSGYVDIQKEKKYIYFLQRQEEYDEDHEFLNKSEESSRRYVAKLRQKLLELEADEIHRANSFRMEKAYFLNQKSAHQKYLEINKRITHEKLLLLSNRSYAVLKKLKEFVKKGELLLGLAMYCRKYMTENEKVNVMRDASDETAPVPEPGFQLELDTLKHMGLAPEEIRAHMDAMKNFRHRYSSVQLHNIFLTEEKRKLTEENEKYRNIIRSMKQSDDFNRISDSIKIKQV